VARQVDGDDTTNRRKGCTLQQPILGASAKTMDKQQCLSRSFERITQCSTIVPKAVHNLAFSITGTMFQSPSFNCRSREWNKWAHHGYAGAARCAQRSRY
jgi:hypothetical protein